MQLIGTCSLPGTMIGPQGQKMRTLKSKMNLQIGLDSNTFELLQVLPDFTYFLKVI